MDWPARVDTIRLWRNDRWSRVWPFFNPPPDWVSGHSYVAGVVESAQYLADSTVSHGFSKDGLPVFYTCTTAHTSGASFDATKWAADPLAVGPPLDLTIYGDTLASEIRSAQDEPVLADLDLSDSDLATGVIAAKMTQAVWDALDPLILPETGGSFGWDIEIRASAQLPLTVLTGRFSVSKDWTHA